jgi:hypothetical protein
MASYLIGCEKPKNRKKAVNLYGACVKNAPRGLKKCTERPQKMHREASKNAPCVRPRETCESVCSHGVRVSYDALFDSCAARQSVAWLGAPWTNLGISIGISKHTMIQLLEAISWWSTSALQECFCLHDAFSFKTRGHYKSSYT